MDRCGCGCGDVDADVDGERIRYAIESSEEVV
jgi:hypothetical protein